MFVLIGGVGPHETSPRSLSGQQCPACGAETLQERRVDQVRISSLLLSWPTRSSVSLHIITKLTTALPMQVLTMFFVPFMTIRKGRPFKVCSSCGWDSRPGRFLPTVISEC